MINYFLLAGDSRFFWPENIRNFAHLPLAWDNILNTGIGQPQAGSLWITSYLNFSSFFSKFGLGWNQIELFFWILPSIVISFISSFYLFRYLFKTDIKYALLSGVIYVFNTFFLMTLTGGQLGVILSYSLIPFVLLSFIALINRQNLRNSFVAGIVLGLQIVFDPRVVYITVFAVFIYFLFNLSKFKIPRSYLFLVPPFILAGLLNAFWISPFIFTGSSAIPIGFGNLQGFGFFSFADFSHAFSLLHPNWPENIFGKTYFLKPEFLVLPILAFSSLLFKKNKNILFFSLIAILGAFLSKGVNDPFGFINSFLFNHLPGMVLFRDPVKWYSLIALSYSILIPYAIFQFQKKQFAKLLFIVFLLFYLYLNKPLIVGSISGLSKPHIIPNEYAQLKDVFVSQPKFFRTLWIPAWQRFGYFSNNHPAIGRSELLKGDYKRQVSELKDDEKILQYYSVKYVIVPYDSQSEIFLKDRKYDDKQYFETVSSVSKISWLKYVGGFGKIAVFEVPNPKDHFWSPSSTLKINYSFVDATNYKVQVENAKKGDILVFSEAFDNNWVIKNSKFRVSSSNFDNKLNSFVLSKNGDYGFDVYYSPQKFVNIGLAAMAVTLIFALFYIKFGYKDKK